MPFFFHSGWTKICKIITKYLEIIENFKIKNCMNVSQYSCSRKKDVQKINQNFKCLYFKKKIEMILELVQTNLIKAN